MATALDKKRQTGGFTGFLVLMRVQKRGIVQFLWHLELEFACAGSEAPHLVDQGNDSWGAETHGKTGRLIFQFGGCCDESKEDTSST